MTSLHVLTDDLMSLSEALTVATQEIQDTLDALIGQADRLRAGWSGEAQRAFDAAHSEWNTQLSTMRALLGAMSKCAGEAATRYDQTDRAVAALWA